jgi:hypothetical protein
MTLVTLDLGNLELENELQISKIGGRVAGSGERRSALPSVAGSY